MSYAVMFAFIVAGGASVVLAAGAAPIATIELTPGWVTFGQAVPQGAAFNALKVGGLDTQTDVKTRWADGSIRFAVVTTRAPLAGSYPLTAAAANLATFTPVLPAASVSLVIGGDAYTAALPGASSSDLWLSGPLAYEGRSVVAPLPSAGGAPHPFLRVNFDTRVYNDGKARVDVSVENVLDKIGATTVAYDVAVTINGTTRFTKAAVEHYYLTRWRKVFDTDAAPLGAIIPDIAPFNVSRALPAYLPIVANNPPDAPSGPTYEILSSGALDRNMPAHGGVASLAPYPDWTARYLVHKNPAQRDFVLANGDLSGSWPVHVREADDSATPGVGSERLISIDQRPHVWLDERAAFDSSVGDYVKGTPLPIREYGTTDPGPGQSPLIPDNAHQPSLAYVPYLLTGDRYYAEEMAFWANYGMLRTYNGDGVRSSTGILENNEVRGYGWSLRNLVDAAAYYPGSDVRNYLSAKVANNLRWLDAYVTAIDPVANPLKFMWTGYRPEPGYISLWEQTYLAYAIDRANKQGFSGGLLHRDAIADLQLKLFTSEPDYPRQTTLAVDTLLNNGAVAPAGTVLSWSAPYLVAAGGVPDPTLWSGFTYYTSLAQVAATTTVNLDLPRDFAGNYGPEARLNLMIEIERGAPGAQASYDYLYPSIGIADSFCSHANGGLDAPDRPDLACRAGWALDFYPPVAPVAVADTTAPVVTVPADISTPATSAAGAPVSFAASAADLVDGPVATTCTPAAGSNFAIGVVPVECRATDAAGNTGAASFTVTVTNNAPAFTAPANITTSSTSATGALVTFTAIGSDIEDGSIAAACAPASGTIFAIGTTSVGCTVTDSRGATASGAFTVTVLAQTPPPALSLVNPGAQRNFERDKVDLQLEWVMSQALAAALQDCRSGSDGDRCRALFLAANLPPGLKIDASQGRIQGHIDDRAAGVYPVVVMLTVGNQRAFVVFTWTVLRQTGGSGRR